MNDKHQKDYWSKYFHHLYQRLIVDISDENTWINNLFDVYHSFITDYIDDERKPIYWQSRSYIKECYLQGEIL